jgi:hypothetical protein
MKRYLAILVAAGLAYAGGPSTAGYQQPYNSQVWIDTVVVSSTNTAYSDVFWQDNGSEKMLVVEAMDTTAAGFAADSACVSIRLQQVAPIGTSRKDVVVLSSHAHPDSTSYPGSSVFYLWDSLNIRTMMDTTAAWVRHAVPLTNRQGDTVDYTFSERVLDSTVTATRGYGAFVYTSVPPDYSPGLRLRLTGKACNKKTTAKGSIWILRWFQTTTPVKVK